MKQNNHARSTRKSPSKRRTASQQSVVRDDPKKKNEKLTSLALFNPTNIGLEELLEKHPIDIPHARDKLVYLLHLIHAVPAFRKNKSMEQTGGYTILYSAFLKNRVDDYSPLLIWLIERGILETDGQYIPGKKSKGYRFSIDYRVELKEVKITSRPLIKNILFNRKSLEGSAILKAWNFPFRQQLEEADLKLGYSELAGKELHYLRKWFNDKLKINTVLADKYLRQKLMEEQTNGSIEEPMHNYNRRKLILEYLAKGQDVHFYVDDTSGRLHTFLTNLKTQLRAFLTYDGKTLVSADIKNSQPLLSLVLLNSYLFHKNRMLERIAIYNPHFRLTHSRKKNINNSIYSMLGNLMESENGDVILYRGLVLKGQLYEYFGHLLQTNGLFCGLNGEQLRKQAKKEIFRAFFDRNQAEHSKNADALRLFKAHFPTVFRIFSLIKTGKHNTLACCLQNLEAEIVLHKACKDVYETNPDIPMYPIHDSIATIPEYYPQMEKCLMKQLYNVLEQKICLKKETWDESLITSETSLPIQTIKPKPIQSGYGYADETDILKPYTYTIKQVAKNLGVSSKKLLKFLRNLNVVEYNSRQQNVPTISATNEGFFIRVQSTNNFITTRVTETGVEFINELIDRNHKLFVGE